jgi:alkylation response protein AidB-like acyl-CoA dehydrogenase
VEYTLGPEGGGLLVMLSNFNHERFVLLSSRPPYLLCIHAHILFLRHRWVMCCSSIRSQRLIVEECFKWGAQRKVFGKPLLAQAVIRAKMASMVARVESAQNWLESVTHQMCKCTLNPIGAPLM